MTEVPFPDEFFDAVLSLYLLHHDTLENIRRAVGEIKRALRQGGLLFGNLLGKGDHKEGKGRKVEPGTHICDSGIEAGMPHHFFARQEVEDLLEGLGIMSLKERGVEYVSRLSGQRVMGVHWEIRAQRLWNRRRDG